MTLPTIKIGDLDVTRVIVGGNPFSGFSHQSPERDREMLDYYTVERIKKTLFQCEAAGMNSCVLRVDAHIWRMLREYRNEGGKLQWIAQTGGVNPTEERNIDLSVANGAVAHFLHGGVTERFYKEDNFERIAELLDHIRSKGIPAGVAAHAPEVHLAIHERELPVDFHVVCFYDCGSVHQGEGEKFDPADPAKAVEVIQKIDKPCIGYKIMGAGRRDAREAMDFAFANIKPTDAVCVGMYTGDKPNMAAENAEMAREILERPKETQAQKQGGG